MNTKTQNNILFKDLFLEVLNKDFNQNKINIKTYEYRKLKLKKLLEEELFQRPISKIDEESMSNFFNGIYKKHSLHCFDSYFFFIKRIFKYAENKKYITKNIMENITRPKKKKIQNECLSLSDQKKLTNYLINVSIHEERYKHIFLLELYTGLLFNEIIALDINDIDLTVRSINVHQYISFDKNGEKTIFQYDKQDSQNRVVYFPKFLTKSIQELVEVYECNKDKISINIKSSEEYKNKIFLTPIISGNNRTQTNEKLYIRDTHLLYDSKKIPAKLNLETKVINVSILRATYITRLVEANIPFYIIQNFLGFRHINSVYQNYKKLPISKIVKKDGELSEEYLKSLEILDNN